MAFAILLAFLFCLGKGAVGELICEELPAGLCSYSIDSSRHRCVLETSAAAEGGATILQCKKSEVVVNSLNEHIENDQCINACGLDRFSFGISTDSLADSKSVKSLCSADCYQNCPNIIDLYENLALEEGAPLQSRCESLQLRSQAAAARRRELQQLKTPGPSAVVADPLYGVNESPLSFVDCPPPAATPGQF